MKRHQDQVDGLLEKNEGSPRSGEPLFLVVGKVRRPHGIRGELVMEIITDYPERIQSGNTLYAGEKYDPVLLESIRWHNTFLLIKIRGYDTPEAAGVFRNVLLYQSIKHVPELPEGEYYHYQLIGLLVVSDKGENIGTVQEILVTGANDVIVVKSADGKEQLIPMIESVVMKVDLKNETIHIKPPEWD